jgi:prephenate dehydrogenase
MNMRLAVPLIAAPVFTLALLAAPARAQVAPPAAASGPAADPVSASIDRLTAAVTELVALARQQSEQQDISLALLRLQSEEFALVDSTRRVEERRQQREDTQTEVDGNQEALQSMEAEWKENEKSASPEDREQLRQMQADMRQRFERDMARAKERLKELDLDLAELDNQAGAQRDEVARWEEVVDRYFARKGK